MSAYSSDKEARRNAHLRAMQWRARQMRKAQLNGLGFLPAATEAGAAVGGPIGAIIGGIIDIAGAILGGSLIGPPSDQTSYVPPADSATRCVSFSDNQGTYGVAYDVTSQESLAQAIAKGNYLVDIYSYYSVFLSGSLNNASPAAQRVIQDYARNQGVSIQRAAENLLYLCGLKQTTYPAGCGVPTPSSPSPQLPGYCPAGTYHPYPIGDPQQDLCVPFPPASSGGSSQQQPPQAPKPPTAPPVQTPRQAVAPPGYWLNPRTGQFELIPQCPAGTSFDPNSGQCLTPAQLAAGGPGSGADSSWLWLLLLLFVVYEATDNGSSGGYTYRRRR